MGTFYYPVDVGDAEGTRYERVDALVDTGASYSVMPAPLLRRLRVALHTRELFTMADGRQVEMDMGQTWMRADGRPVISLVVFGSEGMEPILGAYTLDGLALGVDPTNRRLVPTPRLLMTLGPMAS